VIILRKGKFIVLEGIDGSGKTTQMRLLCGELTRQGINFVPRREPTEGVLGEIALNTVKGAADISPHTLALVFAADRIEHIEKTLLPLLNNGTHVICDRYVFSNFAYQGLVCPFDDIYNYNRYAINTLMPDLTVFIDTGHETAMTRINSERENTDIFDTSGMSIRANYISVFNKFKDSLNIVTVNGDQPQHAVAAEIWAAVSALPI
jgi:dTMP kinase